MAEEKDDDAKVSRGKRSADQASQSARPASFEEGLARLADLVGRLEGGQLGLAESIAAYESGVGIVRALHAELADVEQRVRILTAPASDASAADDATADSPRPGGRKSTSRAPRGAEGEEPASPPGTGAKRAPGGRARKLPGMDDAENDV